MFPGLKDTAKHARKMSTDASQTDAEKAVWTQIADEIDSYIAGDGSTQAALFEGADNG